MQNQTTLKPYQAILILVSIASLLSITQLFWMQTQNKFGMLWTRIPLAAAAGIVFGGLYLFLIHRLIKKQPGLNGTALWKGLTFFHVSLFGAWLYVSPVPVQYAEFVAAFILTAGAANLLSVVYQEFGSSLSNRSRFAKNFVVLATTTMLVISVVKSSLALSLGLVGALSIVRFRTAIKDPEELAFLFFTIALGLGFGAGQILYTMIGFLGILSAFVCYAAKGGKTPAKGNYLLTIQAPTPEGDFSKTVATQISTMARQFEFKRIDTTDQGMEIIYLIELAGPDDPRLLAMNLKNEFPKATVSITHTQGIV